jgi:multimeric flavodoxin WrbA
LNNNKLIKNVVAINGSPRKATTFTLLKEISTLLRESQVNVTLLNLGDYKFFECTGCELCIRKTSKCFQNDDTDSILQKLVKADGVILASPVYVMNITGRFKDLIDKTASWIHRPPLVGKPALFAATSAGAGLKGVLDYLEKVAVQWGAHPTNRIARSMMNQPSLSFSDVEDFVWHLNNPSKKYSPSLKQLFHFSIQKALALNVLPIDKEYWTKQRWDQQIYYYPAQISLLKRAIAQVFFKHMNQRMREAMKKHQLIADYAKFLKG